LVLPLFTGTLGDTIKDSLYRMAEKLGGTSEDEQRKLLSQLEKGHAGYIPHKFIPSSTPIHTPDDIDRTVKYKQGVYT